MKKIAMISLGCSKNLVDSELMLGFFNKHNCVMVDDPNDSDIIIINTCGFIENAKKEGISTIFDSLGYQIDGKKIVVTGCLVERYLGELKKDIPEVDLFIPIKDYPRFGELMAPLLKDMDDNNHDYEGLDYHSRVLTTQKHFAYVKISEGCDNKCHYCAIPLIRGAFRSRKQADIIEEIKNLVKHGVKEIILISQDTTRYGYDFKDGTSLITLLEEINKIDGYKWVRFLYMYPAEMTYELIDYVATHDRICNYFDMPIQHANNRVLEAMNRRDTKEDMQAKIAYIRSLMPKAVIRTTIIVGYPTETDNDFEELVEFCREICFDKMGAFTYSREEDTVAYSMEGQIDDAVKEARYDRIFKIQEDISYKQNEKRIGEIQEAVIEEYDPENDMYLARSYAFAPDDIDGYLFIKSDMKLELSNFYKIEIINCDVYNLYAKIIK